MNLDPRFLRSQKRLHEAILGLSATQRPETITVTEIAKVAEVHRSTVYEHAESPEQLLRQAITAELDGLWETDNPIESSSGSVTESSFALLRYLESREDLYRHMGTQAGAIVAETLSNHLATTMLDVFTHQEKELPDNTIPLPEEEVLDLLVHAVSDGIVRVYATWLRQEAPRDPELALKLLRIVLPSWWSIT